MNAPFTMRRRAAPRAGLDGRSFALHCAQNVFAGVDRRSSEATALAGWLAQHATGFGLSDEVLPGEGKVLWILGRGVSSEDWRTIELALTTASLTCSGRTMATATLWIAAFRRALELDSLATQILTLALHYVLDRRVEGLLDAMCECRGFPHRLGREPSVIGLLLRKPVAQIAVQLHGRAKLLTTGLLHIDRYGNLTVLDRLVELIRQEERPEVDCYGQLLGRTELQALSWSAFAHLGQEAEIAATVLQAAMVKRERGVNILLYGPPGTGKTSFAATLAERVCVRLRPVAEADEDGGEPSRFERLAGLRLAQRLSATGDTVLLFDEAEDLFVSRGWDGDEQMATSRVFIHRLLERVEVPVIWTANNIHALGPAVLRRMTMCLELRVPDLATRTRLWRSMGEAEGVMLQETDAARLARLVPAAPAVASAALRATRLAGGGADMTRVIVERVARAVYGRESPAPEQEPDRAYDPRLVNADCDLAQLADDLLRPGASRAVSFLLYGPPGAGKSAWVRHLASRMGMPVLHKRASDLLNMYVGGTEQNIAAAFAEAREAQAFLVFDEAESLLLERADATRSWEISQVNEMLTWMESHALPFACTTNLADRLDRASLRRFLVKLRFDWLTVAQARIAFRECYALSAPPGLDELRMLTPADFALVRRRAAVQDEADDPAELLHLLAAECRGRLGARQTVGFNYPAATPNGCRGG